MATALATDEPRDPSCTVLFRVIVGHLKTFLASTLVGPEMPSKPVGACVRVAG
jgi:hypothetical protein